MLIMSTKPVAEIIQAVSAPSILAGAAAACANAGVAASAISIATPFRAHRRATANLFIGSPRNF